MMKGTTINMAVYDEVPDNDPAGDGRVNVKYVEVHRVLAETPGKWRAVVDVTERRDAQRWRQAGKRKGWEVRQVRQADGGWRMFARVTKGENQ